MQFILENWYLIFLAIAAAAVAIRAVYAFAKRPTDAQFNSVKNWLLWSCTEAERELGSGTGKLKLRYVYNAFLSKFPLLSKIISFDMLSDLVTDVLVEMRKILETNDNANAYVYGMIAEDTSSAAPAAEKEG